MRKVLIVLALMMLVGCAPIAPKYIQPQVGVAAPGTQIVSIERAKWLGNSTTPLYVFVDGEKVASLGGGQVINLHLPLGRHIIGVGMSAGASRSGNVPDNEIAVDVSKDKAPILRTTLSVLTAFTGIGGWNIKQIN